MEEGKLDEAREAGLLAVGALPYDPAGYTLLGEVADRSGNTEDALLWARWQHAIHDALGEAKLAAPLAERLDAAWPTWRADEPLAEAWLDSVAVAARKTGGSSKLYRVSGELYDRLLAANPRDKKAAKAYEKLVKKAGGQASGGGFVSTRALKHSAKWIERQDKAHEDWKNAFRVKTPHYDIKTNIGYEFSLTIASAMEQIDDFYRDVYRFRKSASRLNLNLFRKRSDFDRFSVNHLGGGLGLGVGGWFDRNNTVAAYDRSEGGGSLEDLYRTVFHEASHYFMSLLTKDSAPIWLTEGVATYFEGARLTGDGRVVKNRIPDGRAFEWLYFEKTKPHTLKDLITRQPGQYPVDYYSYGWALTYFLLNYETESGTFLYRDAYDKYLKSYTRRSKLGPYERAVEFFVEDVADPEVPNWDAFEERWHSWTEQTIKDFRSGAEFTGILLDRAERYLERGDAERAVIAAEQAYQRSPRDQRSLMLLARGYSGIEADDDALYYAFLAWEIALSEGHEELDAIQEWIGENGGKELVSGYCEATRTFFEALLALAESTWEEGHPAQAALFLARGVQIVGSASHAIRNKTAEIREATDHDVRLWRQLVDCAAGDRVQGSSQWLMQEDGVLGASTGGGIRSYASNIPDFEHLVPPYTIRGRVRVDGPNPAGIWLGSKAMGGGTLVRFHAGTMSLDQYTAREDGEPGMILTRVGQADLPPQRPYDFEIEVLPGPDVTIIVNNDMFDLSGVVDEGTDLGWTEELLSGRPRLVVGNDTAALFTDVEVLIERPFWPMPPLESRD